MISQEELVQVLEQLEARESELLCWGDTGAFFTIAELEKIITEELPEHDPDEVEDKLRSRSMVIPVLDARDIEIGIRTRMAEALHLYRNLRQWFIGQEIDQSRTLVSDYRFIRQRRNYPKRDLDIVTLIDSWKADILHQDFTKQALKELTGPYKLSGFQARATEHVLRGWEKHRTRQRRQTATIICAGTGTGKTMAFYLPALSSLATSLLSESKPRVRILAIYPQRELLKDQFSETWEQSRKLDAQLDAFGVRKIRIGALFGETPFSNQYLLKDLEKIGQEHFHYQFLKCPDSQCQGEMHWSKANIIQQQERLACHLCGKEITGDEVALTRQSIQENPPDILFTTTEMLNQRMSDTYSRHLFSIGVSQPLPLVLMDEVHTYGGSQGAQTAMLLRRWMRLSGKRPHFVGLSATLRNADSFFASLTSAEKFEVNLIEPKLDEMEEKGAEYLLALRGDPVSQTALLSTTIQAAMLTRRILDNPRNLKSKGAWGSKTFIFTDDLNVKNRLFSNLANAEGWEMQSTGQLKTASGSRGPLAQLRNASTTEVSSRKLRNLGQDWAVSKAIGYSLDKHDRSKLSKTSSQDVGFDRDAEVIVTTASLEVGFNDHTVGAIIQHKAPRGVASYLQRRGRAGRPRTMRPWMLVVLSAFGRDRVAYEQYENLIDPELKLQSLPIDNTHLLRIHAAQAVLDWLSMKLKKPRLWTWLNKPKKHENVLKELLKEIESAMEVGPTQKDLSDYIRTALSLSDNDLSRILWQPPRSIFLEFLPTLRRCLASHWGAWSDVEGRIIEWAEEPPSQWSSPVPGFIPASSFKDLNTPDLYIRLERGGDEKGGNMTYFQGLNEFAPGKITKRFSTKKRAKISDWLIPESYQPGITEDIVDFELKEAFGEAIGIVAQIPHQNGLDTLGVYQPREILTTSFFPNGNITDRSNAFLHWDSVFLPPDSGDIRNVPKTSNWDESLLGLTFFSHSTMSPLELIHYSTGSDAELKFRDGRTESKQFKWVTEGKDTAVGARLFVDAVSFQFSFTDDKLLDYLADKNVGKAVRIGVLQDRLNKHPVFSDPFTANWVFECFVAAVFLEMDSTKCELQRAIETVCSGHGTIPLTDIPTILFQGDLQSSDSDEEENSDKRKDQKLQITLKEKLTSKEVLEVLRELSECLYLPIEKIENILDWTRDVLGRTLAAAFQQALCILFPHTDDRSMNPYVRPDSKKPENLTIWLCEAESGGMGVVSELQQTYNADPLKVLNTVFRCLQPGDYEQIDVDLHEVLKELTKGGDLARRFEKVRGSCNYKERLRANRDLRSMLTKRGFVVSHTFSTLLHSRILRSGSTAQTDAKLLEYLDYWTERELDYELEVPLNAVATMLAVKEVSTKDPIRTFECACSIQSLLWVRGSTARESLLNYYNPFVKPGRTERLLGALVCQDHSPSVIYSEKTWLREVHEKLDRWGHVDLRVTRDQSAKIPEVLSTLHVRALDTRGLLLHPRVRSLSRHGTEFRFRIELPEAIH